MKKITLPLSLAAAVVLLGGVARSADIPDNWTKNCASCHGPDGAGHTKAGRMAQVKDMTKADYQASFTDEQAIKQIKDGLKDPSGKERMRAFSDKLSDDDVKALVAYVRSLSK
jgi:mono/diheme cytochrome c family protein